VRSAGVTCAKLAVLCGLRAVSEEGYMKYLLPCLIASLFVSGCSTRIADLTVISPHNVSLKHVDIDSMSQVKHVEGVDKAPIVLFFPLGQPNLEEAISDALRKGGGDLMTDVTVYEEAWWAVLFGQKALRVKGTVVKTRGN
jgi:hypothetical protein